MNDLDKSCWLSECTLCPQNETRVILSGVET